MIRILRSQLSRIIGDDPQAIRAFEDLFEVVDELANPDAPTKHSDLDLDDGTNPHGTTPADVGISTFGETLVDDASAAAARSTLGLVSVASEGTHSSLTLDDGTNPHGTTKSDVGLSSVANALQLTKAEAASTSNGEGASLIGIEDSAANFTGTDVEAALAELASGGGGGPWDTDDIVDDAITAAKIAANAVGTSEIATNGVGADEIAAGAVGVSEIATNGVGTTEMRNSTGTVSSTSTSYALRTLPGGAWGFYPRVYDSGSVTSALIQIINGNPPGSATTHISLRISGGSGTLYAYQNYLTSSSDMYWIFELRDKTTGEIVGSYEAPDHPSVSSMFMDEVIDHPFPNWDPVTGREGDDPRELELIVMNPEIELMREVRAIARTDRKGVLQCIHERFEPATIRTPLYPETGGTAGYVPWDVNIGYEDSDYPFVKERDPKTRVVRSKLTRPSYALVKKLVQVR